MPEVLSLYFAAIPVDQTGADYLKRAYVGNKDIKEFNITRDAKNKYNLEIIFRSYLPKISAETVEHSLHTLFSTVTVTRN